MKTINGLCGIAAGLTLAALPAIAIAAAPASHADDFDCIASVSLNCMMQDSGNLFGNSGNSGIQAGDPFVPAGGGPIEIAAGPGIVGGPVVTAGGGLAIPAAPAG